MQAWNELELPRIVHVLDGIVVQGGWAAAGQLHGGSDGEWRGLFH